MTNLNNRDAYDREVRRDTPRDATRVPAQPLHADGYDREVRRDANGNVIHPQPVGSQGHDRDIRRDANGNVIYTQPAQPSSTSNSRHSYTAYRDGYANGRYAEHRVQEEDLRARDNDNAARGLLLGILLTSLAGLIMGLLFLVTQRNQTPVPVSSPSVAPTSAPANQAPNRETTIIERTTTDVIPVPQPTVVQPADGGGDVAPDATQTDPTQPAPTQTAPTQPTTGTGTTTAPGATGGTVVDPTNSGTAGQ